MKMRLFTIIFSIFVFSVGAAAQEDKSAPVYERAKIWDKEIDAFAEIDRRQTPPDNPVLFVGSSSMRGWRNLRASFPQLKVVNRGFGGSRLEDVVYYFDRVVAPYNPRIIVLYAGENDVNEGIAPETVAENYRKFSALARARFPKTKIVCVALKPSPSRWKLAENFRRTNALLKVETEKDKRAAFVDVFSAMLGANGEPRPELFVGDQLHMNEKGYEIWRGLIEKHLK